MVTGTIVSTVDTHSVRIRIDDASATIDLAANPHYPDPARVTELAINYETRTGESSRDSDTKVTSITYLLDHKEHQTAFVHPDFLDSPGEWPDWVRAQVDQHRPRH